MLLRPVLMPILRNPLQGIADGTRNMLAELLGSSQFFAPLTHSLVLARGTGSPTFTRADATNCATFTDWEGGLKTVPSGCARFEGARMVRNYFASTEDFSTTWVASVASVSTNAITSPTGTLTADKLIPSTGSTAQNVVQAVSNPAGTIIVSCYLKTAGYSYVQFLCAATSDYANFDISTGVVGTTGGVATSSISSVGDGWYRCSAVLSQTAATTFRIQVVPTASSTRSAAFTGDGTQGVYLWGAQLENVTGQADQTASEYVSVGVLSAPYHGAGVDGVKYFNTDLSGNPIAASTNTGYVAEGARTNLCLQSNAFNTTWIDNGGVLTCTQNVVGPDGGTTAWTMTDDNASAIEGRAQAITLTAAAHTFSVFVKKTSGATTFPAISALVGAVFAGATIDTNNGTATVWASFDALTPASGMSARCYSHNTNFWRAELTFTGTAASWTFIVCPAEASTGTQSAFTSAGAAAVTGSAVFYGAQLELGSFASSYIATTTAAVTRNAEIDSVPTTGNILAAAGWISLEYTPSHSPSGTVFLWGTYVDASNYTAILHDGTNLIFRKRIAATNYDATIANAFTANSTYKMAASWGAAGTSIALNGTLGTGHANTTAAQIAATMQIGADGNSLQQPFMALRNDRIGQRQLSASEMQAVTR